jgi:hypothetical protein
MPATDDPEERIRELERPLADAARASELGSSQPPGASYPPVPTAAPAPTPWTHGVPFPGPPPQPPSGNRMWWILGTVIAIAVVATAVGIAIFAGHQLSGVRSIISSPPTVSRPFGPPASIPSSRSPSNTWTGTPTPPASATPPRGGRLTVSGLNEKRTITCNDSIVDVAGASNTVVITGHCASLSVSGLQNEITVDAVDSIDASGLDNKITYHSGTPKISNTGVSNIVQQG